LPEPVIRVEGLRDLNRALRQFGDERLPKQVKAAARDAADIVAREASRRVPHRSGRLAASIRAGGQARGAVVRAGGARVPYAGWIEFGGTHRVRGRGRASRPYVAGGRYIRPSARDKEKQVIAAFERGIEIAARPLR
jgi:hypothetical protein